MNTIVLAAGKIDHSNIIRSGISSYGMMPVRGKPFILWCIESVEKNIIGTKIVVVVRSTNLKLIRYLESLISQGKNLQLSIFDDNTAPVDNILVSVLCGCSLRFSRSKKTFFYPSRRNLVLFGAKYASTDDA